MFRRATVGALPLGMFLALLVAAILSVGLLLVLVSYNNPAVAQSITAVPGTTITVNTTKDETTPNDGKCSLREAIQNANDNLPSSPDCKAGSATDMDAIHFSLGDKATIKLVGSQLPTISDDAGLTIDGRKKKIKISGNDAVRVFSVGSGAVFALRNLTVAEGNSDFGAGLRNEGGEVEVWNSTFSGNSATVSGGGIRNELFGTLTVTDSTFSGNSATFQGGGIENHGGTLTVIKSTFSKNSADFGGGIENFSGTLEATNSTFSGNKALSSGGGIENGGTLTVTNSTFSANSSPDNAGGGILNNAGGTVTNSTFSGNSAFRGGGIYNDGTLTVTNSTISGNSADDVGGGIRKNQGTATLRNTIVANSTKGGNCFGAITDAGYNIEDGTSCAFSAANNSLPSTEPKLSSSLAKNGGPTKTIALLKGSPALNAIPQATNGCGTEITTDQRGVTRPQGPGCDIGAFEKKRRR